MGFLAIGAALLLPEDHEALALGRGLFEVFAKIEGAEGTRAGGVARWRRRRLLGRLVPRARRR